MATLREIADRIDAEETVETIGRAMVRTSLGFMGAADRETFENVLAAIDISPKGGAMMLLSMLLNQQIMASGAANQKQIQEATAAAAAAAIAGRLK